MEPGSEALQSAGWSAPVDPVYDMYWYNDDDNLNLELPVVKVNRGGISFKPTTALGSKDQRFLDMACGVALESACKFRHGAVVVKHGHILGSSTNVQKNDPLYVDWKHSQIHAEIAAMKKAGWPTKATIYVARVNGKGEARLSKPCANCAEVLDQFKMKVIYTES